MPVEPVGHRAGPCSLALVMSVATELVGAARRPWTGATIAAAAATAVVAVGADVVAGSHTGHVAVVAVVAVAVGIARVRMAGRFSWLFALLSAAVVAQPVVHAATSTKAESGLHHLDGDSAMSVGSVVLAIVLIGAVGAAESVLRMVRAGLVAWFAVLCAWLGVTTPPDGPLVVASTREVLRPRRRAWQRFDTRRGPPGQPAVVAG